MQIQQSSTILQFRQLSNQGIIKQSQQNYFNKHWQVIQTSIKFFILQKASVNLVAFKKSLELLVLHRQTPKIRQSLTLLWRQIFGTILKSIQQNQSNPLISLIQNYKTIQDRLKIIFTILRSYIDISNNKTDYIDEFGNLIINQRQNVQNQAYNILCKLILNSEQRLQYEKQMILLIQAFRNSSYSNQNIISQETCRDQVRIDLLILKKIGLFRHLQQQFDQTSKQFYVSLSEQIPKDQKYLYIVNQYLQRQIDLNKIFQPKQNTIYYVEKQLIRQYYEFILNQLLQPIIINKQKKGLKILWNFTLRLKDQAFTLFSNKIKSIIYSVKKYFIKNHNQQDVFKLITFRQNLFYLTEQCFQKNRKIFNLIYHTFQQLLYEQEKHYLNVTLKNILQQEPNQSHQTSMQQQNQNSANLFQNTNQFKLFRIAPSKQNFIKQFEIKFSKWILNKGFQIKSLRMQQKMIHQMKKQVGNNLMKKLDRMLNDIYRESQMHYYQQLMQNGTLMKCMFLSNNWPIQLSIVFNIPDELYNMQNDFESEFKKSIQNKQKSVKWLSQMGSLRMAIHGIQSTFTQIQASILMILDKSIRPLKKDQIQASLNICNMSQNVQNFSAQTYLSNILQNLVKHKILTFNEGPQTYDINDENKVPYKFQRQSEQTQGTSVRRTDIQRDNGILIQAAIVKILKKRKNMQRSDITRFIQQTIKNFKPNFDQITKAFEKLHNSHYIEINREKGIISYVQ